MNLIPPVHLLYDPFYLSMALFMPLLLWIGWPLRTFLARRKRMRTMCDIIALASGSLTFVILWVISFTSTAAQANLLILTAMGYATFVVIITYLITALLMIPFMQPQDVPQPYQPSRIRHLLVVVITALMLGLSLYHGQLQQRLDQADNQEMLEHIIEEHFLARHSERLVLAAVRKAFISEEWLLKFSQHPSFFVRFMIMQHPTISCDQAKMLAEAEPASFMNQRFMMKQQATKKCHGNRD